MHVKRVPDKYKIKVIFLKGDTMSFSWPVGGFSRN